MAYQPPAYGARKRSPDWYHVCFNNTTASGTFPLIWCFALIVLAPDLYPNAAGSFAGRRAMQPPGGASSISLGDASSYSASPYAAAGRGYSAGVVGGWGGAQDNSSGAGGYGGAYSAGGYGVGGEAHWCGGRRHACRAAESGHIHGGGADPVLVPVPSRLYGTLPLALHSELLWFKPFPCQHPALFCTWFSPLHHPPLLHCVSRLLVGTATAAPTANPTCPHSSIFLPP